MHIVISGSMKFFTEISHLRDVLQQSGHVVSVPTPEGASIDYHTLPDTEQAVLKKIFIDKHLEKIRQSDAILVANFDTPTVKGYIGANTFLEMGFAYVLGKKIFLLNDVPEQSNKEELLGLCPVTLSGDCSKI